jgi:uncharacterized protein
MNYIAAYTFVMGQLESNLPRHLYYHNPPHTVDVVQAAEDIGRQSKLTNQELQLLRTAALFHDTGLLSTYSGHEAASIEFAREHLPGFGYSNDQIEHIVQIILSTRMPQSPTCQLSEIMCDADLDYLGRPDYFAVSHKLRLEWFYLINKQESLLDWYRQQYDFLKSHTYFTSISRKNRNEGKKENIRQIGLLLQLDDN